MEKESVSATPAGRIISVDALRGFDMFWIIGGGDIVRELMNLIINPMPHAVERQFQHAEWIGFNAWDMIMPLFLFIVGASLPYSLSKYIGQKEGRGDIYRRIAKRFVILFILGICVQGHLLEFHWSRIHFYSNTLQAIACGYVVAAVLLLNVGVIWQGVACAALLIGYWILMFVVPVPGHAAGTLTPHVNLAMFIDETILGRFRDGTTYTWILSSMTFSATVLFGVMSGHILRAKTKPLVKFVSLAGAGVGCVAAGWLVGNWFPVIKHVWSTSFALCAAGYSYLLLAFFYGTIDLLGLKRWPFFFVVIGSNALFVYCFTELVNPFVGAGVVKVYKLYGVAAAAPLALGSFVALWLLLYVMFRKKIFLRV